MTVSIELNSIILLANCSTVVNNIYEACFDGAFITRALQQLYVTVILARRLRSSSDVQNNANQRTIG